MASISCPCIVGVFVIFFGALVAFREADDFTCTDFLTGVFFVLIVAIVLKDITKIALLLWLASLAPTHVGFALARFAARRSAPAPAKVAHTGCAKAS